MTKQEMTNAITKIAAHVNAELSLSTWSPGDGWTRYRISKAEGSGESHYTPNYTKKEMTAYLWGALDTIYRGK